MRELLFRIRLLRGRRQTAQTSAPAALPPTGELTYDAFVLVAREQLAQTTAALALVRVPLGHARRVVAAIRDEIRRRDTMGRYDRGHVLVLLPQVSIGAARDRLADLVQRLRAEGINGVHAGVAGSPAPNAASLESLVAEADEALAEARHRVEAAAVKSDRPRRIVTASHLTVLIADDDPEITRVVDAQMRAAGYHTIAAFDGEQAMQAVASRAPDVVVLDLTMPKLSGFDVLGRLHQFTGARPSIVVLSARGQEDDVRRAFELGADDYITKPFDAQELLARVTRVLR